MSPWVRACIFMALAEAPISLPCRFPPTLHSPGDPLTSATGAFATAGENLFFSNKVTLILLEKPAQKTYVFRKSRTGETEAEKDPWG